MSQRGRGGEESSLGKSGDIGSTPIQGAASVRSTGSHTEATSAGVASIATGEKSTGPLTPTTPTLEAATTGTESEQSSEHGRDEGDASLSQPRQVIAVSVSKGPSAFFNLARKFLVTDEVCDLSALEGAIVSAVDAAHLLERSKIATIIRIQTSYVAVEPKKKKEHGLGSAADVSEIIAGSPQAEPVVTTTMPQPRLSRGLDTLAAAAEQGRAKLDQSVGGSQSTISSPGKSKSSVGAMRRARIVITVRRTDAYKKWLQENPIQDTISGDDDDRI